MMEINELKNENQVPEHISPKENPPLSSFPPTKSTFVNELLELERNAIIALKNRKGKSISIVTSLETAPD